MWCVCVCLDVGPSPPVVLGSFVPQMMDTSDDAMYWRQHFCYTPERSFLGGVVCCVVLLMQRWVLSLMDLVYSFHLSSDVPYGEELNY